MGTALRSSENLGCKARHEMLPQLAASAPFRSDAASCEDERCGLCMMAVSCGMIPFCRPVPRRQ